MQRQIIIFLIGAVLVAIFALTNAQVVSVRLFFWTYELSQALIILFSVVLGALLIGIFNVLSYFKRKGQPQAEDHQALQAELDDLRSKNQSLKEGIAQANHEIETLQNQMQAYLQAQQPSTNEP